MWIRSTEKITFTAGDVEYVLLDFWQPMTEEGISDAIDGDVEIYSTIGGQYKQQIARGNASNEVYFETVYKHADRPTAEAWRRRLQLDLALNQVGTATRYIGYDETTGEWRRVETWQASVKVELVPIHPDQPINETGMWHNIKFTLTLTEPPPTVSPLAAWRSKDFQWESNADDLVWRSGNIECRLAGDLFEGQQVRIAKIAIGLPSIGAIDSLVVTRSDTGVAVISEPYEIIGEINANVSPMYLHSFNFAESFLYTGTHSYRVSAIIGSKSSLMPGALTIGPKLAAPPPAGLATANGVTSLLYYQMRATITATTI